jgi:hypothetical protein
MTVDVPCVPELQSDDRLSISLYQDFGASNFVNFRKNFTVEKNPSYIVLASQTFYATMVVEPRETPAGSKYTCRKSNTQQSPAVCTKSTTRGGIAKTMQFRATCNDPKTPLIEQRIDINVTIAWTKRQNCSGSLRTEKIRTHSCVYLLLELTDTMPRSTLTMA